MNTKLTLKLNKGVIEKAKIYAKKKHQSLSEMVENYFKLMTIEKQKEINKIPHLTKELSGIIKTTKKINPKEEYTNYLMKKYK